MGIEVKMGAGEGKQQKLSQPPQGKHEEGEEENGRVNFFILIGRRRKVFFLFLGHGLILFFPAFVGGRGVEGKIV